jgi:hypothetical protein
MEGVALIDHTKSPRVAVTKTAHGALPQKHSGSGDVLEGARRSTSVVSQFAAPSTDSRLTAPAGGIRRPAVRLRLPTELYSSEISGWVSALTGHR